MNNNDIIKQLDSLENLYQTLYFKTNDLSKGIILDAINHIDTLQRSYDIHEDIEHFRFSQFLEDAKYNLLQSYANKESPVQVGDYICVSTNGNLSYGLVTSLKFISDTVDNIINTIFFNGSIFLKSGKLSKKVDIIGHYGILDPNEPRVSIVKITRSINKKTKLDSDILVSQKDLDLYTTNLKYILNII